MSGARCGLSVSAVRYDHLQGRRFRHAAIFARWRPDKRPRDCRYDQLEVATAYEIEKVFSAARSGGRDCIIARFAPRSMEVPEMRHLFTGFDCYRVRSSFSSPSAFAATRPLQASSLTRPATRMDKSNTGVDHKMPSGEEKKRFRRRVRADGTWPVALPTSDGKVYTATGAPRGGQKCEASSRTWATR